MKYDPKKEVIINDAGNVIAREVGLCGYQLVRSQVFFDRLYEALEDLLSTEQCICAEAELSKGNCSVCRYDKLMERIRKWPMRKSSADLSKLED